MNKKVLTEEISRASFWRDLLAECVATFMLMSVQCALPLSWGKDNVGGPVQTALGMCFVVATNAWCLGEFGGIHMNPAVTFSMLLLRRISIVRAAFYVVVQCVGAIAGAALVYGITPPDFRETLAATELHEDMKVWQGVLVEVWLTANLLLTVHGATSDTRKPGAKKGMPTIIIGMAVGVGVASGYVSTGASMNPARTLGPAVMMNKWQHHWIYWVGPLLGSGLATFLYHVAFDIVDKPRHQNGACAAAEYREDFDKDSHL